MKITIRGKEFLTIERTPVQPANLSSPTYNNCTFGQPFPVVIRQPSGNSGKLSKETLEYLATEIVSKTGFEREFIERVLRALEEID